MDSKWYPVARAAGEKPVGSLDQGTLGGKRSVGAAALGVPAKRVVTVPPPAPVSKPAAHVVPPKAALRQAAGKQWQDMSLADWAPTDYRIFVGNLGPEVTDHLLQSTFSAQYPSVSKVHVVREKRGNKSKGYGFVAFGNGKDFLRALKEMDGKYVGSKPVKVTKSKWIDRASGGM